MQERYQKIKNVKFIHSSTKKVHCEVFNHFHVLIQTFIVFKSYRKNINFKIKNKFYSTFQTTRRHTMRPY